MGWQWPGPPYPFGTLGAMTRGRRWLLAGVLAASFLALLGVIRCDHTPETSELATVTDEGQRVGGSARSRGADASPPAPVGGLRLEGQVIDEEDRPVPGARVSLADYDTQTISNDDGSFVFERLASADYVVSAAKGDDTYSKPVSIALSPTSEPVIVRILPAASATLRVVDANGGAPIPGASVHRYPGTTDAHGVIQIRGLRPLAMHFFYVDAQGYEPGGGQLDVSSDVAERNDLTVELHRGTAVSGIVVDQDGKSVPEAYVTVAGDYGQQGAETDAAGAWRFDAVAPGPHTFTAQAETLGPAPDLVIDLDGQPHTGVVVRVVPAPYLVVTVVDEAGNVVAAATVHVEHPDGGGWRSRTDEQGRYQFRARPTGTYSLTATKGTRSSAVVKVDLVTPGRIETRVVISPSTIAGTVVDTKGRPVAGARVVAGSSESFSEIEAISDAKGNFELGGIGSGERRISARRADQQYGETTRPVLAVAGARDVKIVLPDVGTISGRVIVDGKPATYFGVYIPEVDSYLGNPLVVRSSDGRFTLRGVLAGTWSVTVAGPGFARSTKKGIVVQEGRDVDVGDIIAGHGREVRGRVLDSNGTPIAGATVTVHDEPHGFDTLRSAAYGVSSSTTDSAGEYRVSGLAPPIGVSAYKRHIVATHPTRGASVERVLDDNDTVVELVIAALGAIDGRIEGSDEATGVYASRTDGSGFDLSTWLNGTRVFRFENLPPGEYRLRSNAPVPGHTLVTVAAGRRAKVVIEVPVERIDVVARITGGSCRRVTLQTDDGHALLVNEQCAGSNVELGRLAPGPYRACVDERCTQIVIKPAPAQQTIELRAN